VLADQHIRRLTVVFDDMGSLLLLPDGSVAGYGTEIGAFVRLDDLQPGFAYAEVERAIFMNPHKTNARLVIPLTPYREIMAGHRVDYFLYANNYERVEEGRPYVELFPTAAAALKVFPESETVTHLAEFGVVFLMFSIGLEFSLRQLRAMHQLVFGLGAAQVSMMLVGTVLATVFYYGQDWRIGVAVGAACAMSSTAIVAKLLSERFELNTPSGKQTMGVLLFQDMAVVPLLILIPALGVTGGDRIDGDHRHAVLER